MSYKLRKLDNEPITLYTMIELNLGELPKSDQELLDLLAQQSEWIYHIIDVSALHCNMDELIQLTAHVGWGENATFRHPIFKRTVREMLMVTDDPALSVAGQALGSDFYAGIPARIFKTLEDALSYARAQINPLG